MTTVAVDGGEQLAASSKLLISDDGGGGASGSGGSSVRKRAQYVDAAIDFTSGVAGRLATFSRNLKFLC